MSRAVRCGAVRDLVQRSTAARVTLNLKLHPRPRPFLQTNYLLDIAKYENYPYFGTSPSILNSQLLISVFCLLPCSSCEKMASTRMPSLPIKDGTATRLFTFNILGLYVRVLR